MDYAQVYANWEQDPEGFWLKAAEAIDWVEAPKTGITDKGDGFYDWFADAKVNTCWNALDRHVEAGRGDQAAVIYDSPMTDSTRSISYREMRDEVAQFAGALAAQGIEKGDRVIIYMPMVPEAQIGRAHV